MNIWIITNGIYEDEKVVGVAHSHDEADAMIWRMIESDRRYDGEFMVLGPFVPGQAYDRFLSKI